MITREEAAQIVIDRFGGEVLYVEEEQGGSIYEVEVINSRLGDIEVEVDATTGEIVDVDID